MEPLAISSLLSAHWERPQANSLGSEPLNLEFLPLRPYERLQAELLTSSGGLNRRGEEESPSVSSPMEPLPQITPDSAVQLDGQTGQIGGTAMGWWRLEALARKGGVKNTLSLH